MMVSLSLISRPFCPSNVSMISDDLSASLILIQTVSGTINGRLVRVNGQIGVMTIPATSG